MARLRDALRGDIYGVLGNHDSITMVPDLEALGIRVLLNECVAVDRGRASIYLAGVDDAHFYRADNIEKGCGGDSPRIASPSCYRTRRKYTGRPRMPVSV